MLSRKKCLSLLKEYPFIEGVASATCLLPLTAVVIFIGLIAFLGSCLDLGSSSFAISSIVTVVWMIFSIVCLYISKKGYENRSVFDSDEDSDEDLFYSKPKRSGYLDNGGCDWNSSKEFKDGGELFGCGNCGTYVHISRIENNRGKCPWCGNQGSTPKRKSKREYELEEEIEELETKMKGMI